MPLKKFPWRRSGYKFSTKYNKGKTGLPGARSEISGPNF